MASRCYPDPMSLDDHLTADVHTLLSQGGWTPHRCVPNGAPEGHPSATILEALSGLRVGSTGAGDTCARSDIRFFLLSPGSYDHRILDWNRLLRTSLVGVAEVHNGHGEMWVAADGRCFNRSIIHDAFSYLGADFAEALQRLLLGQRCRPLIHPDQESVMMYGDVYTRENPEVYDFRTR